MRAQKPAKGAAETAADWMAELGEGELGLSKRTALTDWLRESPRNVREITELTLLDDDVSKLPFTRTLVDTWVNEARSAAASPTVLGLQGPESTAFAPSRAPANRRLGLAIAASVMVAVLVTMGYRYWRECLYSTGFGEQRIVALADGSVVTLNTSSQLQVNFSEHKRSIELLHGEAYFRVAHDATRPFEVTADNATVKAIGTQFNVRIAPGATVVSVVDGVVEVRHGAEPHEKNPPMADEQALKIKNGEEARLGRNDAAEPGATTYIVKTARAGSLHAAAWTRGRVEFEDTPLIDVLSEFQRYRELDVSVAESLRQIKLSGSFDAQDPESAFAYIDTLPGITVEKISAHGFIIRQDKN